MTNDGSLSWIAVGKITVSRITVGWITVGRITVARIPLARITMGLITMRLMKWSTGQKIATSGNAFRVWFQSPFIDCFFVLIVSLLVLKVLSFISEKRSNFHTPKANI